MSYEEIYLWLWAGLAIVLTSFACLFVYWAFKTRDLPTYSHANILPLISGIPEDEE